MLMEATVPRSHRWIPKSMNVQYVGKATTSLRARAELEPPDFAEIIDGADLVVPVSVTDRDGGEVVHADIAGDTGPLTARHICPVAASHLRAVELQHFAHRIPALVPVIDHQDRRATVNADDVEM
jgi:hypothetical protein